MFNRLTILFFALTLLSLNSCKDSNGVESNKIETPDGISKPLFFNVFTGGSWNSSIYKCENQKISIYKTNALMFQEPIGDKVVYLEYVGTDSINLCTAKSDLSDNKVLYGSKTGFVFLSRDMKYVYELTKISYDSGAVTRINLADKSKKVIIDNLKRENFIELSPDGTKIAYFSAPISGYRGDLHICNVDGSSNITVGTGYYDKNDFFYHLNWSRDGKYLTTRDYDATQFYVFTSSGVQVSAYGISPNSKRQLNAMSSSSVGKSGTNYGYAANDQNGDLNVYQTNSTELWKSSKCDSSFFYSSVRFDNSANYLACLKIGWDGKTQVAIFSLADMKVTLSDFVYGYDFISGSEKYVFPRLYWMQ